MLVLSRKKTQTIRIGDNVVVKIVNVKGGTVVVGIEAPRDVAVVRGELLALNKQHDPSEDESDDGDYHEHGEPVGSALDQSGPLEADGGPPSPLILGETVATEESGVFADAA